MLATPIFIFSPSTVFNVDNYTISLFVQDTTKGKYLALGDYVRDTASNEYEIITATIPFVDGANVTLKSITNNIIPVEDVDYNSVYFTPGQKSLISGLLTSGTITSSSVFSFANYEYNVEANWDISTEANKAIDTDLITDADGKSFIITFIDPNDRFLVPFRVTELDRTGDAPASGVTTLYNGTPNFNFFRGTELSDPARTSIINRDRSLIDDLLINSGGGSGVNLVRNQSMAENPNGTLTIFTTPTAYIAGTLDLKVNGLSELEFIEISSNQINITSSITPQLGDNVVADYISV